MAEFANLALPHTSIATWHRGCNARKPNSIPRVSFLRNATYPTGGAPWSWKPCFARSIPMMWTCSMGNPPAGR